jgi:curli biogenesis system outer membrane secretion channel CsgG
MRQGVTSAIGVIVTLLAIALSGCASEPDRLYNTPPTAGPTRKPIGRDPSGSRTVVIGHFANPGAAPLKAWNVGPGMSEALAQAALNHAEFDAWIDPPLARRVEALVQLKETQRAEQIRSIRQTHREARYVVYGKVTDFAHTADISKKAKELGLFKDYNQAIAAIQLHVFDLDAERVVATDHVFGVWPAPDEPSAEIYRGLAFGSYMFWTTPLGHASEEAIDKALEVLNRAIPPTDAQIRIVRQIGPRRVELEVDEQRRLIEGRRYYVWLRDSETGRYTPVMDEARGAQVEAYIVSANRFSRVALLKGQKPIEVELAGAVLRGVSAEEERAFQDSLGSAGSGSRSDAPVPAGR